MTSQEAMIFQLKMLKGRPFREIMIHIFTYFWVPIVIVAAVLVLLVSMVVTRVTQKESVLTVCCINAAAQQDADAYGEAFVQHAGFDLSEYEITIQTNLRIDDSDALTAYQSNQLLMAMVAAESLDVIAAGQEIALQCMYADYCMDLSLVLTDAQMAQFRQYLLYMDMDYLSQLRNTLRMAVADFFKALLLSVLAVAVPVSIYILLLWILTCLMAPSLPLAAVSLANK